jgi:large subunit ribosomal protein L9
MEVILKEDIKNLGYKNDLVEVKPGYGRNYLIPQGMAILATDSTKRNLEENLKQASHKAAKIKEEAEGMAKLLEGKEVVLKTKAGESGKIFGAITPLQVSDALAELGFNVDRKKITFKTAPKELGEYEAELDLHKEVKQDIKVSVVSE